MKTLMIIFLIGFLLFGAIGLYFRLTHDWNKLAAETDKLDENSTAKRDGRAMQLGKGLDIDAAPGREKGRPKVPPPADVFYLGCHLSGGRHCLRRVDAEVRKRAFRMESSFVIPVDFPAATDAVVFAVPCVFCANPERNPSKSQSTALSSDL